MSGAEFNPIQPDEKAERSSSKKESNAAGLMRRLFDGMRRQDEERSLEDDETSEDTKKFKRLRKNFSRLFGSKIVERPQGVSENRRQEQGFGLASLFNMERPAADTVNQATSETVDARTPSRASDGISVSTETIPEKVESTQSTAADTASFDSQSSVDNSPEPAAPEASIDIQPQLNPAAYDTAVSLDSHQQAPEFMRPNRVNAVEARGREQRLVEQETIVERRGSMALPILLTGVEYLARKSDTKDIRTTQATVNQETSARVSKLELEQQQSKETNRRQQESNIVNRQSPERIANRPAKVSVERNAGETGFKLERAQSSSQEARNQVGFEQYVAQKPKEVLDNIAAAVEQNIAVERVLERSHEVKDEESNSPGVAQSVGAVLASREGTSTQTQPFTIQQTPSSQGQLPMAAAEQGHGSYQSAMRWGFGVAVTIIVFALIAYLM